MKDSKKKELNKIIVFVMILAFVATLYTLEDKERFSILKKDFTNPLFLSLFAVILIITIIGLSSKEERVNTSVQRGVIAFITAYLAHIDMAAAVFFIVCVFSYYTDDEWLS